MPPDILQKLASVGETSMNSLEFRVTLKGGRYMSCWYHGYSPFIELPEPYHPRDIIGVQVDRGLVAMEESVLAEPDFVWCVYR